MPLPLAAAVIGGGAQLLGGFFGSRSAKKREEAAANERRRLSAKLNYLENNRQEIINPYEGITDLSGMISNPFANLSVATGAAEMQIEEADISLANTLDTIRATGSGAGGATALAQAALKSKQGVSQFMFSTRETRQMQELDRAASMLGASRAAEGQAQSDRTGAITGALGGLAQIAGGYMSIQ